ncbi:MAG: aldo/keto reductase [Chloroflexi bacterium]|nr:aldo/keto reductase [Chloroflexota bacterium]
MTAIENDDYLTIARGEQRIDFRQHVPLGQTGLMVSRLGIAAGYGVPTASIEKAFHEHNLNYFYLSFPNRSQVKIALGNLLPQYRDETIIVLPHLPVGQGVFLRRSVEAWLRRLDLDTVDVIILQDVRKPSRRLFDRALKLKEEGKVRFIGMSSHERPFFGSIARGEIDLPLDLFQIRYNVVHRGAEEDIFPHLPQDNSTGIVIFTATCWRKPLDAKNMPAGEAPLSAADCYRFVLSNPNVNVCITGPSNAHQMEENLAALSGGPLSDEEMARR